MSAEPENPTQTAWLALRDAVNAAWTEYEAFADERTLKAMRLAKKLYRSRHCINADDPIDNPVSLAPQLPIDGKGWSIRGPFAPAWASYYRDALDLIDIMDEADDPAP